MRAVRREKTIHMGLFVCVRVAGELKRFTRCPRARARDYFTLKNARTCCRCISSESSLLIMHSNETQRKLASPLHSRANAASKHYYVMCGLPRDDDAARVCAVYNRFSYIYMTAQRNALLCLVTHKSRPTLCWCVHRTSLRKPSRDFHFGFSFTIKFICVYINGTAAQRRWHCVSF
jgi:hypothetical protein